MSGLKNRFGKQVFCVTHKLKQFNGIKDFLKYQDLFSDVVFDDEVSVPQTSIIINPWNAREDKGDPNRPLETCRFENNLKDKYNLDFEVDDSFELKFPEFNIAIYDGPLVADRWTSPVIDTRRPTGVLESSNKFRGKEWLDYRRPLLENCYIIKKTPGLMYTTFTGVSILGDLLNKEMIVFWGDDIRNWDNKPIQYSYEKHFYQNRRSKLVYLNEWNSI